MVQQLERVADQRGLDDGVSRFPDELGIDLS